MSDITISPVPYNGGTLANNFLQGHYILLNPTMLLHVSAQTSPNYVFAWVSTTTGNLKAGTASFTAQPMRAILSFSNAPSTITQIRLWKLTSNRALLLLNFDFYVIEVGASNDISVRSGKLTGGSTFNAPTINPSGVSQGGWTGNSTGSAGITGSWLTGWSIRDNVVWIARRTSSISLGTTVTASANGGIGMEMWKITYDPTADTLTPSFLTRLWCPTDANVANYSYVRVYMHAIPNSTKKLVYTRIGQGTSPSSVNSLSNSAFQGTGANGNGNYSANPSLIPQNPITMIDTATDQVDTPFNNLASTIYGIGTAIRLITPLSTTKWMIWNTSNQYRIATLSGATVTLAPNSSQVFPGPTTGAPVTFGEALDANYFALWSCCNSGGIEIEYGNSTALYLRIGRYVDNDIAQLSSATTNGYGLYVPAVTNPVVDQDSIVRYDTDTFLMFGRAALGSIGSAVPVIRVIYQPGG